MTTRQPALISHTAKCIGSESPSQAPAGFCRFGAANKQTGLSLSFYKLLRLKIQILPISRKGSQRRIKESIQISKKAAYYIQCAAYCLIS